MRKFIVILAAIAMVGAFVATAVADVSVYGSARFRTYSIDRSKERGAPTGFSDRDTEWRIGHLTRLGFNFKTGDVGGKWEQDARATHVWTGGGPSGASSVGDMRLRLAYGWWNFGQGQLLIGQNYPLVDLPVADLWYTSGGFQPAGGMGIAMARTSQIRLTFGNLAIAFLTPDTSLNHTFYDAAAVVLKDTDTILPKIEVRYTFKFEPVTLDLAGGWQSYDVVMANDNTESMDCYVLGLRGKANFGAGRINGVLSYRVNGENYGIWNYDNSERAAWTGAKFQDVTAWALLLVGGYKMSDLVDLEAGYGMINAELDAPGDWEDTFYAYYFRIKFDLAPGVSFRPEFMKFDYDEREAAGVKTKEGDDTIIGAFWKIDFK
jgi:hypothetical protein